MGHNKPFGSSPEIEESLPEKLVGKVGEGAHEAISSLWDQMLGVGDYKTSSHDAKSAHSSHDTSPSHEGGQAKHASEGAETKKVVEGILFQLGLNNQDKHQQSPDNHAETRRPAMDLHNEYFRDISNFKEKADSRLTSEVRNKIEQITSELKQLVDSTKELKQHFGNVAVEPPPQKPGKYHENFFDWLLIMVKQARQKVENSSAWLGAIRGKGKGKGKGDYWDRAEKEGTTFTQSMDRSASTSVG